MLACNRLLRILFRDLVGFARQHSDEFDAAFDEEVAGFFGEGHGGLLGFGRGGGGGGVGGEDFGDDFLDRRLDEVSGFAGGGEDVVHGGWSVGVIDVAGEKG